MGLPQLWWNPEEILSEDIKSAKTGLGSTMQNLGDNEDLKTRSTGGPQTCI